MSVRYDYARTGAGRAFEVRTMLAAGEPDPGVHVPAARYSPGGLDGCRHDGRRTVRRRPRGRPAAPIPILRGRHAQGRPGRARGPRGRRRLVPVDGGRRPRRPRRRPRRPRPRTDRRCRRRRPVPGRIVRPTGRSRAREVHVPALGLSILAVRVLPASRYPFSRHSFSSKVFAIKPAVRVPAIAASRPNLSPRTPRHKINRRRTQRVISPKNHTSAGTYSSPYVYKRLERELADFRERRRSTQQRRCTPVRIKYSGFV